MSDTKITGDATSTGSDDRSTKDRARDKAGEVAEHGREEAAHVGEVAKSETARLAREAGSEAKRRADEQASNLAGMLNQLADELDEFAGGSDQSSGYLKGMARDGADTTRRTAERLEQGGLDGALHDVSMFARRRPGAFLAAAFGTGLLLGRVTRNADVGSIAREAGDSGGGAPDATSGTTTTPGSPMAGVPKPSPTPSTPPTAGVTNRPAAGTPAPGTGSPTSQRGGGDSGSGTP